MEAVLRRLLELRPLAVDSLESWWLATRDVREQPELPVDRALLGGVLADRLGYAFAGGYQAALDRLVPGGTGIRSLCITEARGNSPKDIDTVLDGNTVTGKKKWATAGPLASELLVCAKIGVDDEGRNKLVIVRVPASAAKLTSSAAPFVPEIPHAEVELDRAQVIEVLPGDGYAEYVKPFRTIEDIHVHAAVLGYAIGVARRNNFARDLIERMLATALATRALATADPKLPHVHLALAGIIGQTAALVHDLESAWRDGEDAEYQRWQRDRALLRVAGGARAMRIERAWMALSNRASALTA
jgi:acyl-CoA dehydrogenase